LEEWPRSLAILQPTPNPFASARVCAPVPNFARACPLRRYKTHRDSFHDYKHPNAGALARARRSRVKGLADAAGTLAGWLDWLRPRLSAVVGEGAAAKAVAAAQAQRLDPLRWSPAAALAGSGGRGALEADSSAFELALVGLLLGGGRAEVAAAFGNDDGWVAWLEANHARGSHRLLSALLGGDGGGRAANGAAGASTSASASGGSDDTEADNGSGDRGRELMATVRRLWEESVGAPPELVWTPARAVVEVAGAEAAEPLEEDILGPPWVEPNRHCTLMYYLNELPSGGGETTFPLAEARAVATPDGRLHDDLAASTAGGREGRQDGERERGRGMVVAVAHPGMPECSKGLRVRPFAGGGALFYHKHGDGVNDPRSSHGGCPPLPGPPGTAAGDQPVSWKINGFMWNTDSGRGPSYFRE